MKFTSKQITELINKTSDFITESYTLDEIYYNYGSVKWDCLNFLIGYISYPEEIKCYPKMLIEIINRAIDKVLD